MAFQPIVNTAENAIFAYEALCRGPQGESAASVLSRVTDDNRYAFDQHCRVKAITLASKLGLENAFLSINFMPGAVYSPAACIQLTLRTAEQVGFPLDRLIFEITENEQIVDRDHLQGIFEEYRRHGFQLALDDFGSGFSGLRRLAELQTDLIKLDMDLVREVHVRPAARKIISHLVKMGSSLGIQIIAEGIETSAEYHALQDCGITLMQGYLFARPEFEALPNFQIP